MEKIEITEDCKLIVAKKAMLNNSTFFDVAMANVKITTADLSDIEIEGAQLGGAIIHNIGLPPEGHPMYNPTAKQRPVRFEDCDLNNSTFTNCDLNGVKISDCNLVSMKVNGILVEDMLKAHKK